MAIRAVLESTTLRELYEIVWRSVRRFAPDWDTSSHRNSPRHPPPSLKAASSTEGWELLPSESKSSPTPPVFSSMNRWVCVDNGRVRAYDGLEYESTISEFPFRLCRVKKDGSACSVCNVLQACTGCLLPPRRDIWVDNVLDGEQDCVAIDWDPRAYRSVYNIKRASLRHEHSSVKELNSSLKKAVRIEDCMVEFAKKGEVNAYCSKCTKNNDGNFTETKQSSTYEVWATPPFLIVQLKRFMSFGRSAYKLQNRVEFPIRGFDIEQFVAKEAHADKGEDAVAEAMKESETNMRRCDEERLKKADERRRVKEKTMSSASDVLASQKAGERSRSLVETTKDMLAKLPNTLRRGKGECVYDLYAVCHHTGYLGGGHYFAHALATDETWWEFNDRSTSKLTDESLIVQPTAYLLFYRRRDVATSDLSKLYPRYFENERNVRAILREKWRKPKSREKSDAKRGPSSLGKCSIM